MKIILKGIICNIFTTLNNKIIFMGHQTLKKRACKHLHCKCINYQNNSRYCVGIIVVCPVYRLSLPPAVATLHPVSVSGTWGAVTGFSSHEWGHFITYLHRLRNKYKIIYMLSITFNNVIGSFECSNFSSTVCEFAAVGVCFQNNGAGEQFHNCETTKTC